jgi:hypothetical protein
VLAPTGAEPPFAVAQALVLLAFIGVGIVAWRRNGTRLAFRAGAA